MTQVHMVSRASSLSYSCDIVFVHGLSGHPSRTWEAPGSQEGPWHQWLADDIPQARVLALEYDAAPSHWVGYGLSIYERSLNLLAALKTVEIGIRPTYFICHSLGGLIFKSMLRTSASSADDDLRRLAENTKGVVFFATPHSGAHLARLADTLKIIASTQVVKNLRDDNEWLIDLNVWFRGWITTNRICPLIFAETRPLSQSLFSRVFGSLVVSFGSADPGIPNAHLIPLDADHIGVCKFEDKSHIAYRTIVNDLQQLIRRLEKRPNFAETEGSEHNFISFTFGSVLLHYLDHHFLAMKDISPSLDQTEPRIIEEAILATKFALSFAEVALVPASSYMETELCRYVLSHFNSETAAGRIFIVGKGKGLVDYLDSARKTYPVSSSRRSSYEVSETPIIPFLGRERSATTDIAEAWRALSPDVLATDFVVGSTSDLIAAKRRFRSIPDIMEGTALIPDLVEPVLLPNDQKPENRRNLAYMLNAMYFESISEEFKCAKIVDLAYLSGGIPFGDAQRAISYRRSYLIAQKEGILARFLRASGDDLWRLGERLRLRACERPHGRRQ